MKKALIALAIAVCALAQAVCCVSEGSIPVNYKIDMVMLKDEQAFEVRESVKYTNQTGSALSHLLFSLPANCFRRESTLPYDNATLPQAFENGYSPSGAEILSVTVDGESAEWAVRGENECFVRVAVSLKPGESCETVFGYMLLLSENRSFLGVSDTEWRLTGFYPSVCVYEDGDFAANPLTRAGKSHYSEIADFEISVTAPADYETAAAGELIWKEDAGNGWVKRTFVCKNAREAALCVSRKFHKKTAFSESGIPVYAYGQNRALLSKAAENAAKAIDSLESMLVPFPYPSFTIVESSHAGDSLTASGMVILNESDLKAGENEIARFVAYQYFGDYVHPNPAMEAWLADGLSEYAYLLYLKNTQGNAAFTKALNSRILPSLKMTVPGGITPASETYRFQTRTEYEAVARHRAAAALHEVHLAVGEEAFFASLREYLTCFSHAQPVSDDFVSCMSRITGRNRADTVYGWLYTIGDYADEIHYEYD